ncbi:DUF1453 domain-containing protein [Lentzea tibetensis]|uniref:DUF1453 domain-containing protein n=1 Tax=Lentzea tibetensis TaxID=2591470 RepID=A0A563EHY8_9PSEU|nr:DUF1453 domain-containing protein [Lentzea tibetensis]TWP46281.1 DUF1453 domain-containing protein [Lentzea tibetensis]
MLMWFLIAAAVVAVVVKRFTGEPLNVRDLAGPAVVLTAIGLHDAQSFAALPLVVGFAFGILRGVTIKLFEKDGHLWQRYTWQTLVVWAISIGVGILLGQTGPRTLSIGVGLLGELCAVGVKALRTGVGFAPERSLSQRLEERFSKWHGSS